MNLWGSKNDKLESRGMDNSKDESAKNFFLEGGHFITLRSRTISMKIEKLNDWSGLNSNESAFNKSLTVLKIRPKSTCLYSCFFHSDSC